MLTAILSALTTVLLTIQIVFMLKFKRSLPDIQQVLDDVGGDIGQQLSEVFSQKQVSSKMSDLGKKSGEARAAKATRNKVINYAMDQQPAIKMILNQVGLSPEEGFALLRDPTFGPIIQGFLNKGMSGLAKTAEGALGGVGRNNGGGSSSGSVGYG